MTAALPTERPTISTSAQIADMVDAGLAALASDQAVYQRDGRLVHVIRVSEADADATAIIGTPQSRIMTLATLRERLSRAAVWLRTDARTGMLVPALPPESVVQAARERGEYPQIRPLIGIIESPSMRPDGSILQSPGYDRRTAYLYAPSAAFAAVPDAPSQDDARRALEELEEPFNDFPFRSSEHRASAIAAVLTVLARPAIRGSTPAVIHDANTRGAGKTLEGDVISLIATGREAAKMQYPATDDELEKVLAAYGLRGAALIAFDNVTGTFGGAPLDRCLTSGDLVELRVLGRSEVATVRWRAVVMATGNNVVLAGDTSRRVIISRLESPLENPEDRQQFGHSPLLQWVESERPRLVVAALTLLRAWHVAGRPLCGCRSWGSFEAWSALIPPAIVFSGGRDPMRTRPAALGEAEPEKSALIAILDGLARLDPTGVGQSARAITGALYTQERLRGLAPPDGFEGLRDAIDALVDNQAGRAPSPTKVGSALRRFRRRIVGNRMLDCAIDRKGVARWRVTGPASPAGDAGDAGAVSLH